MCTPEGVDDTNGVRLCDAVTLELVDVVDDAFNVLVNAPVTDAQAVNVASPLGESRALIVFKADELGDMETVTAGENDGTGVKVALPVRLKIAEGVDCGDKDVTKECDDAAEYVAVVITETVGETDSDTCEDAVRVASNDGDIEPDEEPDGIPEAL